MAGAAANKLTSLGIHVIVVGRNAQRGENTVAEIRAAGGEADFISSDLRDAWPTHEMTEELFESVYSLNVKVPYFLVAELAPLMAKRGKGAIVNLLTKVWAAEYGPSGVRVNAVSPGTTRTEGTEAMGEALQQLAAQAPAGRPATADEVAEAIVFLATDRASFIHGVTLAVDGGRTAV